MGWIIIAAMIPAPLIMVIVAITTGQTYLLWFVLLFVVFTALFYKLTITVSHQIISLRFGVGLIRKKFELTEIEKISIIKYPFFYGYGVRRTPKGWLYNVAGNKAVELIMKDGKFFWLGTDDPDGLERAIRNWATV